LGLQVGVITPFLTAHCAWDPGIFGIPVSLSATKFTCSTKVSAPPPCRNGFWSPCKKQLCPPARTIPRLVKSREGMSSDKTKKRHIAIHWFLGDILQTTGEVWGILSLLEKSKGTKVRKNREAEKIERALAQNISDYGEETRN